MRTNQPNAIRLFAAAGLSGLVAISALGQVRSLPARGIETTPSTFSLIFDASGFRTDANIAVTQFTLDVDPTTGIARFTDYYQEAGSLTLSTPDPAVTLETGDLTIEIVPGSSSGTYDSVTGEFATTDLYAIYFTGDLSLYGIESPFVLPGDSAGNVNDTSGNLTDGTITLLWDGGGVLPPGAEPEQGFAFTYQCQVNAGFSLAFGCAQNNPCPGDVNNDCVVMFDDLIDMLSHFGDESYLVTRRHGDVNGDGAVDLTDLGTTLLNFGGNCD